MIGAVIGGAKLLGMVGGLGVGVMVLLFLLDAFYATD